MQYPYRKEFPEKSRSLVLAEEIRSGRAFEEAKREAQYTSSVEDLLRTQILQVFLVFVREGVQLVRQGIWDIGRLQSEAEEFLRRFTIDAHYNRGFAHDGRRLGEMISHINGSILYDVERAFRKNPLWKEYEDLLLQTAAAVATVENSAPQEQAPLSEQGEVGEQEVEWESVEMLFISDERVRMTVGTRVQTYNYAEMGFEDKRTGKPNQAWGVLRALAQNEGAIPPSVRTSKEFLRMGKRIERIRQRLQNQFRIASTPIVHDSTGGYCCRFKIGCGPSFKK